jgi:hypothetical protein
MKRDVMKREIESYVTVTQRQVMRSKRARFNLRRKEEKKEKRESKSERSIYR